MVNWSTRGASTVHLVKSASGTGNIPVRRGVSHDVPEKKIVGELAQ